MISIRIDRLGSNSVLGYFTELYLRLISNGGSVSFESYMDTFYGATVITHYDSTGDDEIDNKIIQGNKSFCDKYGIMFNCSSKV
jgi:hypothetical protein